MASLQDDVAFITGAASGFGLALAKELVSKGAKVIMVDINDCEDEATKLNSQNGKIVAIARKADTTSWEQQYLAYEAGKVTFGRIDYFFANAGIAEHPWLPYFNPATTCGRAITKPDTTTLDINLKGQLYTAALALQVFERQAFNEHGFRGKLLMTASVYGLFPSAIAAMYASSKAGIVNFSRSAALMYAGKGITVNAIAPSMARKYSDHVDQTALALTARTTSSSATNIIGTPEASIEFLKAFDEKDLCSVDFVVEQFMSLLGTNPDNGRVIAVSGKEAWDQPVDSHGYEKCKSAIDTIDRQLIQAFESM
ncbi:NAD-P-binding protein [Lentinula raphanica]|nr:NAD-P-binding protein [Lentinula raphanica]